MNRMISRRSMIALGSAASMGVMAASEALAEPKRSAHADVPRWEIFEASFHGPAGGNPFVEVQLTAVFQCGHRNVSVDGFYDGAGSYKVRFMPDDEGSWSYTTASNVADLNQRSGSFICTAALAGVHGPVGTHHVHHFAHADGTPYFPFGTTCYAWIHQSEELQRQTLATLKASPFNKLRMCLFPKSYEYNHNEPSLYPFERSAAGVSDFGRPNPAFYAHLEQRLADLRALDIEADLILFHPYDRWGYATMTAEEDDEYLRYVLARLSAHRNVWWSLANEYDLMKAKSVQDFDRFFHIVERHDPVGHLRSVHYSQVMYDYARPWVTHASLQSFDFAAAPGWLEAWRKPIVFDEIMYEGNLNKRWGNLSGKEMTRRFWLGVLAGCYVTHGETFLDPDQPLDENTTPTLWWSHGGTLYGTSVSRIAFLRTLVEATVGSSNHAGLEAAPAAYYLNAASLNAGQQPQQILFYMDFHQPVYYEFPLPEGQFTAELIDPWARTITPVPGTHRGKTKLKLAAKPYQAVRFQRI